MTEANGYKIEPNADLSGADLSGATLRGADLGGATIRLGYRTVAL